MTLFQSAEYIRTLTHTLHALEDFTRPNRNCCPKPWQPWVSPLAGEMDELYREIYLLKKSMKGLAQKSRPDRTLAQEEG